MRNYRIRLAASRTLAQSPSYQSLCAYSCVLIPFLMYADTRRCRLPAQPCGLFRTLGREERSIAVELHERPLSRFMGKRLAAQHMVTDPIADRLDLSQSLDSVRVRHALTRFSPASAVHRLANG